MLLVTLLARAGEEHSCPIMRIVPERLPDLNVPRSGHIILYANGELTVLGGHTTGFKPTATAEYYKDGEWHLLYTVYDHDNGLAVPLRSGRVLLCGGHSEAIGIGQTFLVEWYDPATHTFTGFSCLDKKRSLAQGIETDSGRVVIAGNHYHYDAIEIFDGRKQFSFVKDVTVQRTCPFMFRTSDGDVIIFGANDNYYQPLDSPIVDRMKGEPFSAPLLEEWQPMPFERSFNTESSFIGDEQKGDFSYLLPVSNKDRQLAIALVRDTVLTLLPTDAIIPMAPFGDRIFSDSPALVYRQEHLAYVVGRDKNDRYYILCIDYAQMPRNGDTEVNLEKTTWQAKLKLYYTDHMHDMGCTVAVLTPDGNLIIAGGVSQHYDNFFPLATTWLLPVNGKDSTLAKSHLSTWLWLYIILLTGATLAVYFLWRHRSKPDSSVPATDIHGEDRGELPADSKATELVERICRLMDEEHLYLNSNLKVQDVAVRLKTNSSYVSECINSGRAQTFSQFINTYRVRHAQKLLRQQPDMKTANVAIESGFSTESAFFRNFKAVTGMTPREWVAECLQP